MTRKEKYQFLRSIGLSSELARKWRDRRIDKIETQDKNIILKNNKELKREYVNYTNKLRYNFLRGLGLSAERARKLRSSKQINVENLMLRKNKITKNQEYYKLLEQVKKEYPKINALTIEKDIQKYVKKYKNVENYGVYTKWGTLTRVEPYKHETYKLAYKNQEIFNANEKQSFYLLYLMYQYNLSLDEIFKIIETDPLYEEYAKARRKRWNKHRTL